MRAAGDPAAVPKRTRAPLDRHLLYRLAVQAPGRDAALFARWFEKHAGRTLRVLREDFCGTAAISTAFVAGGADRMAIGVDHDRATLDWAEAHHLAELDDEQRARVKLVCADVHAVKAPKADLLVALNFSYCVFHQRSELLRWLRHCRACLRPGGAVWLDAFGGGLAQRPFEERFEHGAFAHVWEQRAFDPQTHRVDCRIHFEAKGHAPLRDAFVYDWRLWTVPELVDAMHEVGLTEVEVLWQDPRTGGFRSLRRRRADPHWLAYVVARKGPVTSTSARAPRRASSPAASARRSR